MQHACQRVKGKYVAGNVFPDHLPHLGNKDGGAEISTYAPHDIALWLGHESVETTQIYLEANLAMKEGILAKTTPPGGKPGRYRPGDGLLTFLQNL